MIYMIFFTLSDDDVQSTTFTTDEAQSAKSKEAILTKLHIYKERAETIRTFLAEINISQCMTSLLKLEITVCFFLAFIQGH